MVAPAGSYRRPADRWRGVTVDSYVKQLRESYATPEREPKFERDRSTFLSDMFYRGKHRLFLSRSGWWKEIPAKPGQPDLYHPENYFAVLADGNRTEMVRIQNEFDVRAPAESDQAQAAARSEGAVADYYARRLFTESFRQELALRVQLQKSVGVYGWWDEEAGPRYRQPILEAGMRKPAPDAFYCATCQQQGEAAELLPLEALRPPAPAVSPSRGTPDESMAGGPISPEFAPDEMAPAGMPEMDEGPGLCPHCGSDGVEVVEVPEVPTIEEVGAVWVPAGDAAIEQVPSYELNCNSGARTVRVSGRTLYHNLFWLERERLIDRAQGEKLHPGRCDKLKAAAPVGGTGDTRHLHYQQRIERTYGGTENDRTGYGSESSRLVEYRETWFLPDAYAEYEATTDHDLFEGTDDEPAPRIAAGQRLVDLFPDGMKICWSGDEILSVAAEDARRRWRFVKIRQQPDSFWGRDFSDAIPLQMLLNEYNSLILTNAMNNEAPRALVNSLVVKNIGTYGHPGQLMTYETLPEGVSPSDLYAQFPGQSLAAPAYQYPDMIRRQMQAIFGGNFDGAISGEAGSENMQTATAWRVARARATAKGQTMFSMLAEGYAGILEMILDLFREHGSMERRIEVAGDFAETEALAVTGQMIGRDLEITVRPGSVVPRQDDEFREDMTTAMEAAGLWAQAHPTQPEMPPAVAVQIADRWNTPVMASDALKAQRAVRKMLPVLREAAQSAPQIAAQMVAQKLEQLATMPKPEPPPAVSGGPAPPKLRDADFNAMRAAEAMRLQQQMADPAGIALLVLEHIKTDPAAPGKLRPIADKHLPMAALYEDWLNTDEGLNADPVTVAIIEGRAVEHYQAAAEKQAQMMGSQMMAQQAVMGPMEDEQREKGVAEHASREKISADAKAKAEAAREPKRKPGARKRPE